VPDYRACEYGLHKDGYRVATSPSRSSDRAPGFGDAPTSSVEMARRPTPGFATLLGVTILFANIAIPNIPTRNLRDRGVTPAASAASMPSPRASSRAAKPARSLSRTLLARDQILVQTAQEDDDDSGDDSTSDKGVSPDQIAKYVAVYRAMQRNHSITVEQAAASQGLTVGAFRDLEQRIESDDISRDDARRALAAPEHTATSAATPPAHR
jgi:hypothetical protein